MVIAQFILGDSSVGFHLIMDKIENHFKFALGRKPNWNEQKILVFHNANHFQPGGV